MANQKKNKETREGLITSEMLRNREKEVLKTWIDNQLANITLRLDLLSKEDMEKQSMEFLKEFTKVIATGNLDDIEAPEYKLIINMLQDISRTRAVQGFSPTETATYVFSLKDSILEYLQIEYPDKPELLNRETVIVSKLLDKLGLVTFEAFSVSREEMINSQAKLMIEMATPIMLLWEGVLLLPIRKAL